MSGKTKTSFTGVLLLLITAFIWGSSFIAQSESIGFVKPFTFNAVRMLIGSLSLIPVILIKDKATSKSFSNEQIEQRKKNDKKILKYGALMGCALCIAANFQQFAFEEPEHSAGKIAFITAMYMFIVPLLGLFFRKKVPVLTWLCVLIGFAGLYFLCIDSRGFGSITFGNILAFCCAFFFAIHILLIAKFAPDVDGIKLSCVQFFVCGILSLVLMFIFEKPSWSSIFAAKLPILYSGILSCGVAYTLQVIGQKFCEETIASLLMCMESVFAVLCEAVCSALFGFGGKVLSEREIAGCAIMFLAIILSQLVQLKKER